MSACREPRVDLPRVDLHSHAGRCFLAWPAGGHPVVAALGADSVTDAVRAARAAGVTALGLSAVAYFAVLRPELGDRVARTPRLPSRRRRTRTTSASWRGSARPWPRPAPR